MIINNRFEFINGYECFFIDDDEIFIPIIIYFSITITKCNKDNNEVISSMFFY